MAKKQTFCAELDDYNNVTNARPGCAYSVIPRGMHRVAADNIRSAVKASKAESVEFTGGRAVEEVWETPASEQTAKLQRRLAEQRASLPVRLNLNSQQQPPARGGN